MSINTGYKNNFLYEQEKRSASANTRKNSSQIKSKGNDNKEKMFGGNSMVNNNKFIMSPGTVSNKVENVEDYQRLAKKYYSIILSLQDELTKQTIRNYNLLEENINWKSQLSSQSKQP